MYLVGEYGGRQVENMSESKILKELLNNFDKIDKRFDKMDNYFSKIDNRFDKVDNRFDKVENKLKEHDHRFDKVESIFEEQNIELYNIKKILKKHSSQLDDLDYTTKMIHNQTVRLSLDQTKFNKKIDNLIKLNPENKDENIKSF